MPENDPKSQLQDFHQRLAENSVQTRRLADELRSLPISESERNIMEQGIMQAALHTMAAAALLKSRGDEKK